MERNFVLTAPHGLHARPAANFVRFASTLPEKITIKFNNIEADAKSIMAVLSLAVPAKAEFAIAAESVESLDKIEAYLKENNLI